MINKHSNKQEILAQADFLHGKTLRDIIDKDKIDEVEKLPAQLFKPIKADPKNNISNSNKNISNSNKNISKSLTIVLPILIRYLEIFQQIGCSKKLVTKIDEIIKCSKQILNSISEHFKSDNFKTYNSVN